MTTLLAVTITIYIALFSEYHKHLVSVILLVGVASLSKSLRLIFIVCFSESIVWITVRHRWLSTGSCPLLSFRSSALLFRPQPAGRHGGPGRLLLPIFLAEKSNFLFFHFCLEMSHFITFYP